MSRLLLQLMPGDIEEGLWRHQRREGGGVTAHFKTVKTTQTKNVINIEKCHLHRKDQFLNTYQSISVLSPGSSLPLIYRAVLLRFLADWFLVVVIQSMITVLMMVNLCEHVEKKKRSRGGNYVKRQEKQKKRTKQPQKIGWTLCVKYVKTETEKSKAINVGQIHVKVRRRRGVGLREDEHKENA